MHYANDAQKAKKKNRKRTEWHLLDSRLITSVIGVQSSDRKLRLLQITDIQSHLFFPFPFSFSPVMHVFWLGKSDVSFFLANSASANSLQSPRKRFRARLAMPLLRLQLTWWKCTFNIWWNKSFLLMVLATNLPNSSFSPDRCRAVEATAATNRPWIAKWQCQNCRERERESMWAAQSVRAKSKVCPN